MKLNMKFFRKGAAVCSLFLCLMVMAVPVFADEPETTTVITEAATEKADDTETGITGENAGSDTSVKDETEGTEYTEPVYVKNGSALTPEGNLTIIDDVISAADGNKEFITVRSKSGYTFYIVIDRDSAEDGNVYFLNLVDDSDIYAITGEEPPETMSAPEQKAETDSTAAADAGQTDSTSGGKLTTQNIVVIIAIVAVIAGVIVAYFIKKKKAGKTAPGEYETDEDENEE